jgi:putative transposase
VSLYDDSRGRRIRFTDSERRWLARKAHALGRKVLKEIETLVTPDTLLRWFRELIASKWNCSHRRGPRRPRAMTAITDLVVQIALENFSWGYTRIRGALDNLGHQVGRGTIANILKENGIEPAPERGRHTRWSTFLKAHWECLTARDLVRYIVIYDLLREGARGGVRANVARVVARVVPTNW